MSGDLFVESNSAITVNFLNVGCNRHHPCYSLCNKIVSMTHNVSLVNYRHVLRETNQVTYVLGKRGLTMLEGIQIFHTPVAWLLLADASAVPFSMAFSSCS
uniref:RNase H type-1 domain-containing protein n=1 Tax=Cajanus cajan TaxID=3821 RepID=A0A151TVC6_CAJCA|nr:hypothetical protein KK1_010265 [Cajanus cajan]